MSQSYCEENASYQRPPPPVDQDGVQSLSDPIKSMQYLSIVKDYAQCPAFFQREIDGKGYEEIVNEYVFRRAERASICVCQDLRWCVLLSQPG